MSGVTIEMGFIIPKHKSRYAPAPFSTKPEASDDWMVSFPLSALQLREFGVGHNN